MEKLDEATDCIDKGFDIISKSGCLKNLPERRLF